MGVRQNHPGDVDVAMAGEAVPVLSRYLARHPGAPSVRLQPLDPGEHEVLVVPRAAVELLAQVLAHLARGEAVSVLPDHAELTTQQAADQLNVSRPFLVGLLTAGEIPHTKVGTHRRVRMRDLVEYRLADDARRRRAADELTALGQDMDDV